MKLRDSQRDALAADAMDNMRRQRLLELQQRGFDVEQDPADGAFVVRDAAGGFARVESLGLRTRVTSAEGRVMETEQYPGGRIRRIVDPSGREVYFERDSEGFLKFIDRGPEGGIYRFELSRNWQPLSIDYPDGTSVRAQYSPDGQPSQVIHRDGTVIHYEYGTDGRLISLTDPKGYCTKISNPGPGLSRVIDYANGDRHEYVDDPGARLLRFDVNGKAHALFQETGKDSFEVRYRDGGRERFVFSDGRIVEAVNQYSTVKLTYDDVGRLLSEDTDGRVVRYLRNEVGALVGIVTPDGETLSYARDRDQRLIGITDWVGGHYAISLPPSGPPVELRYPNGLTAAMATNAMGLPATWVLRRSAGPLRQVDRATWEHDPCDRLIAATRDGQRREYQYDKASRLIAVRCADEAWSEHFELDPSGNRVQSAGAPCDYDPMNRLLRQGDREFQYDGLGNQTADRQDSQLTSYTYNGRGQLVGIQTAGRVIEYGYDALGRRLFKRVDGVTTRYQWAGTQLLSESTDDGIRVVRRDYLYCPEFLTPLGFREGSSVYYIHCGRLQEPLCVTDKAGEVVWKADYLAFGRARISVERVRQPWRLPGQYHDDETGLHYAVARYYDPDLGRFLSMDPLRVSGASLNYYIYCDGDPVNRLDPTGEIGPFLSAVLIGAAIGAAIGILAGAGIEMYRQRNQEHFEWEKIGKAAAIGGLIGAIGGAVGAAVELAAAAAMGVVAAGALAGGGSAGIEYCAEVALTDASWDWDMFRLSVGIGATIGAGTAGVGGLIAARVARKAAQEAAEKAAQEAAERVAREAAEKAAREAAEKAAKEAEEKAAREAAERAAREAEAAEKKIVEEANRLRRIELAKDPAHNGAVSPKTLREADVGLGMESQGRLKSPITRDPNPAGAEFIDGNGVKWDIKRFNSKFPPKKGGFDLTRDMGKIESELAKGENVIVDTIDMAASDIDALKKAVAAKGLTDKVEFFP